MTSPGRYPGPVCSDRTALAAGGRWLELMKATDHLGGVPCVWVEGKLDGRSAMRLPQLLARLR